MTKYVLLSDEQKPFGGPAGRMLVEALKEAGYASSEIVVNGSAEGATTITLGERPFQEATGTKGHSAYRGTPTTTAGGARLVATYSSEIVFSDRALWDVWVEDFRRARRLQENKLTWQTPEITLNPTFEQLTAFLNRYEVYAYDTETVDRNDSNKDYNALTDKLVCLGLAGGNEAVVVQYRSKSGEATFPEANIANLVNNFLTDPRVKKVGHNAGAYDRLVLEQNLGITPFPVEDTILYHHIISPDLRHNLQLVGSIYTDAPAWKNTHRTAKDETDEQLQTYCALDCVVTLRAYEQLTTELNGRGPLLQFDAALQSFCVSLQRNGLYVDAAAVARRSLALGTAADASLAALQAIAGPEFNPDSPKQVQKLLYQDWGLQPTSYTDSGQPSTDGDSLLRIAASPLATEQAKAFVKHLREYKYASKAKSTFVDILKPHTDGGLVLDSGRVHPSYLCHGTVSGRLSSSKPNAQNFPRDQRDLIVAPPGRCIVAADMDQLELRVAVALSGAKGYWKAFREGLDPHAITAAALYPTEWPKAVKGSQQWENMRNFAKTFVYAVLFGAGDRKANEILRNTETPDGKFPYKDISLAATTLLRRNWLNGAPEIKKWWEETLATVRRQGYLEEPVLGRRRNFPVLESPSEAINFMPQAIGASLVNRAIIELCDSLPKYAIPINAMHDAIYVETSLETAGEITELIERHLNFEWEGMPFKAKAKVCRDWAGNPLLT